MFENKVQATLAHLNFKFNITILLILFSPPCLGDTSHPDECHFPFHHDGVQYDECTSVDHTQPWCYLDIAGQVSGKWKNCILPVCGKLSKYRFFQVYGKEVFKTLVL